MSAGFLEVLARRHAEGNPIRVGIIGAGKFGGGLMAQLSQMKGMEAGAVADLDTGRALQTYAACGIPREAVVTVSSAEQASDAIRAGKRAIAEDALAVIGCDQVDVVVDATGVPEAGARNGVAAIENGKHLVMVNVETDVTVGSILRRKADRAGVVYTLVDGDQPGCTVQMVDWAKTLGFEIVAAGRGTEYFAEDRSGTPDSVKERFQFDDETMSRRSINVKMYNSFRDGTKAQLEMTALANMTGLTPDVRGMHEPSANLADIPRLFSLKEEGGLLSRHGVVELANSVADDGHTMLPDPLRMGVFVVIRTHHPFTREDLTSYHCHVGGEGGNFLLYRPYHLVAVEAPMSIAAAVLQGAATGAPLDRPVADVVAVAKRDLKQGETLDAGGGYTVNGEIERAEFAKAQNLMPLGLSAGAKLKRDVSVGEAIPYDAVTLDEESFVLQLRREQDAIAAQ